MNIHLCELSDERDVYFRDIPEALRVKAECPNDGGKKWQFVHYLLPPIPTYSDPTYLIQARLRGEYSEPRLSAFIPTPCTAGLSCGEIIEVPDLSREAGKGLVTVSEEDRIERQDYLDCILPDEVKEDRDPVILMEEPIPNFCEPIEVEEDKDLVGIIHCVPDKFCGDD